MFAPINTAVDRQAVSNKCTRKHVETAQPVSKQVWAESLHVCMIKYTFDFHHAHIFQAFVQSHQLLVPNIRKISIVCVPAERLRHFSDDLLSWTEPKEISAISRFTNLEEFKIKLEFYTTYKDLATQNDIMSHASWKCMRLPHLIRAFQQHKLNANGTRVSVHSPGLSTSDEPHTSALKYAIITQLLDYHPRRLSKRGTGM